MKRPLILSILLAISLVACTHKAKDNENNTHIRLETNEGDILIALYDETPLHRDNFIKLTRQKFFDGTLFHRVINDFMIQGGDPESKNATSETFLGNGGPGYNIPAEIRTDIFHKKGALAAAREGDDTNPERASSGSQFYLVEGKVFTLKELGDMEKAKNTQLRSQLITSLKKEYQPQLDSLLTIQKKTGDTVALANFVADLNQKIDTTIAKQGFQFTEKQKQTYTTIGGTPHLDGAYTVFGEILEGQEVVDKIAEAQTDDKDRPLEDIVILKASVVE